MAKQIPQRKNRIPKNQLPQKFEGEVIPTYDELTGAMMSETTGILTDYMRQHIGVYQGLLAKDSTVFINQDPVLMRETYHQWAQYDLYWYLEQDTHVRSILTAAKVNVCSIKEHIKPFLRGGEKKPSATNQAIADFCERSLGQMQDWMLHKYDLMDALGKGFAFSELIWKLSDDGYWVVDNMLNRTQRRIQFDAQTRQPRVRTVENPFWGDPVPPGKYIVHRVSSNWENPFGDAIDQSLYWMWLFKKMFIQFMMKHAEVGASSVPIVKHPAGASPKLKDEALSIAQQIRNGAYGRLPDNFSIEWAEAMKGKDNADVYKEGLQFCNDEMSKCVKGQTLTTEAGTGKTGTKAQGQVHQVTENQFDIFRAKSLSANINKYMIKFLCDYNFANLDGYPLHIFEAEEEQDLVGASTVLVNLTKALPGYEVDIDSVNDRFGYSFTKKEGGNAEPTQPMIADDGQPTDGQPAEELAKKISDTTEFDQAKAPLYIMRHGHTPLDPMKRSDGWIDLPLSDKGRQSVVKTMVDHLRYLPVKKIYAGSLKRHQETAEILQSGILSNPAIKTAKEANTWDLGALAGDPKKPNKSIVKDLMLKQTKRPMGGESYGDFLNRFDPWFEKIQAEAAENPDKPVVCVLSGSNCRRIGELLTGNRQDLDIDEGGLFSLAPSNDGSWKSNMIVGKRSAKDQQDTPEAS